MKKQILFFAVSAMCASSTLMISASPAIAKGARFDFAPQEYLLEEPIRGPRSSFRPNIRHAPTTSVTHGSVPNASTMLGFNPSFLGPARTATVNSTITHAPAAAPRFNSMPNNWNPNLKPQQFGQPAQPTVLIPAAKPIQLATAPRVSGKLVAPRVANAHSAAPRSRTQPLTKMASPKRIAQYGDDLYKPGETKPTASDYNVTHSVNGILLPRPKHR